MADFSDDLIKMYARFLRLDEQCAAVSAELPPAVDASGAVTGMSDEDRAKLDPLRAKRRAVLEELVARPDWVEVSKDVQLKAELRKAALSLPVEG